MALDTGGGDRWITDLLTVEEAARYLRVSVATVRRWCCEGKLPAIKLGRRWRIHWQRLRKLLESGLANQEHIVAEE